MNSGLGGIVGCTVDALRASQRTHIIARFDIVLYRVAVPAAHACNQYDTARDMMIVQLSSYSLCHKKRARDVDVKDFSKLINRIGCCITYTRNSGTGYQTAQPESD